MELAVQSLILAFLLFAVPTVVGGLSAKVLEKKGGKRDICFRWVSGQMILWAGFQVISVCGAGFFGLYGGNVPVGGGG